MSYHVEDRSYPEFERSIKLWFDINKGIVKCPNCNGWMYLVDQYTAETYMLNGSMEREERFYCEDCYTFADITQVYEPTIRKVSVMQDVFDD